MKGCCLYIHRYDARGRKHAMRLFFNDQGELLPKDAEKWARSIAREWGSINEQQKVRATGLPGPAWWFSCAGHGGYIMVAPANKVPEVLHRFATDGVLTWEESWVEAYGDQYNGITVFRFEEDCDWAVFEVVYPDVARWDVHRREKRWANLPVFYELNGDETPLDESRTALAKQHLNSSEEMDRLVTERLQQARESVKRWQNVEIAN